MLCHFCKAIRIKSHTRIKTEHWLKHAFNSLTHGVLYLEPHPITEPLQRSRHIVFLIWLPTSLSSKKLIIFIFPSRSGHGVFAPSFRPFQIWFLKLIIFTNLMCEIDAQAFYYQSKTAMLQNNPCACNFHAMRHCDLHLFSTNVLTGHKFSRTITCRAATVIPMD